MGTVRTKVRVKDLFGNEKWAFGFNIPVTSTFDFTALHNQCLEYINQDPWGSPYSVHTTTLVVGNCRENFWKGLRTAEITIQLVSQEVHSGNIEASVISEAYPNANPERIAVRRLG
jgi:hypothetical protein